MKRRLIIQNRFGIFHGMPEKVGAETLGESTGNLRELISQEKTLSVRLDNGNYIILGETILKESIFITEETE